MASSRIQSEIEKLCRIRGRYARHHCSQLGKEQRPLVDRNQRIRNQFQTLGWIRKPDFETTKVCEAEIQPAPATKNAAMAAPAAFRTPVIQGFLGCPRRFYEVRTVLSTREFSPRPSGAIRLDSISRLSVWLSKSGQTTGAFGPSSAAF